MDLHVWATDDEWVVAKDVDDARAVLRDLGAVPPVGEEFAMRQVPDDAVLVFAETEGGPERFDQLLRAGGLVLAFAFIFVFAWIAVRSEK